jgi:ketosteroid isomerase-like protein
MLLASFAGTRSSAHVAADDSAAETEIRARTEEVRVANLTGDVAVLKRLYTRDFLLTSQSGKRYLIEDAIADSAKGFESYVNSDIMVRIHGDAAIVNFVNDRKRKNVSEPGRFRVTAVWTRTKEGWRMASLQSTKISP